MHSSDTFRRAASLLLLRRGENNRIEILLLHKPRRRDAWQLPQGGVEEGETIEQCALRELEEEAGIRDVRFLGVSQHRYEYSFPASYRRFRPDHICGQRIAFAYAAAPEGTVVQVDGHEINDHRWIPITQMSRYVRRPEYLRIVRSVYDEALKAYGSE